MYLSTKEVANKLLCTKMTISRMVKRGQLTPVNPQKNYFLFDAKEIELFNLKKLGNANK